jgi:conjugal transfer ATP-binding protein TraC
MANNPIAQIFKNGRDFTFQEEIFQNEFIEDNFIVRPDGNLAAGFMLLLPERESLSELDIKSFWDRITEVLEQLPIGTAVHFQSQYFYKENSVRALEKNKVGYLTSKLLEYHHDKPVINNRVLLYLVFNFKNRKKSDPFSHFFSTLNWGKNPLADIDKHKLLARSAVQSLTKNLESVSRLKVKQLSTNELWGQQLMYFNLQFDKVPQFFSNSITNKGDQIQVGTKKVAFVYLQRTGSNLYDYTLNERNVPTFMAWPLGFAINFPHIINCAFIIGEKDVLMKELESKRNISKSLGSLQNIADRSMAMDIDIFLETNRGSGRKLVYFNHNIMAWDTDSDKLALSCDIIKAAYLRMNGSVASTDSFNNGLYYNTFAPGYALDLFQSMILPIDEALNHFDFTAPHISESNGILFCNREGEPILIDLWHKDLPSFNRIVIGPSGSGKSFTLSYILAQEIEQGIELIVIDVGGSYKNLFDFYPSKYYEYKNDVPLSFNPFLIPKNKFGQYDLSKDKVVFLVALITILWKKTSDGETLSREEQSVLTNLLQLYYNNINSKSGEIPRLDRFLDFIEEYAKGIQAGSAAAGDLSFFNFKSFSVVLRTFTHGIYKDILNSDETENISEHRLVCFDLNGIQKDPILFPIVALLIMELVLDKIRLNPGVRKEIVIDEAWSMLTGALSEFIEMLYRTVRKAGGAVTIVSQDIGPIKKSAIGEAVRANAPTKILLDHSSQKAMLPDLQGYTALTDHQMEQLSSIRDEGSRREILLVRNQYAQNLFVDAGPHASVSFSSWAKDRARIQELKNKNGIEYAINQYVEEKKMPV